MNHARLENIMLELIYVSYVILLAINVLVHHNFSARIVWKEILEN